MQLEVRGIEKTIGGFVHLWGRYVTGFKSSEHCQKCLIGQPESRIHKAMADGEIMLDRTMDYFYLCGVGRTERKNTNMHLAVRPRAGSIARINSVYGAAFTIYDAEPIQIERLPTGWRDLTDPYTQCRNFQFGVQMYGMKEPEGALKSIKV